MKQVVRILAVTLLLVAWGSIPALAGSPVPAPIKPPSDPILVGSPLPMPIPPAPAPVLTGSPIPVPLPPPALGPAK